MDDSFKVRVDKVFGSLSEPQPLNNSNNLLWSLTDDEIHKREWNRDKGSPPDADDLSGPFATRPLSNRKSKLLFPFKRQFNQSETDLDLLNNDEDDVDDEDELEEARLSARMCSKPEDHDDDEWIIRSSIGMDCTLDKEEEEDEFDKVAVGREKKGDRIYMDEIIEYTTYADTFYELPTSVEDVGRDPRANHLAAELRLKEDAQATGELNGNEIVAVRSTISSNPQNGLPVNNHVNVRSILKTTEKKAESKSRKRVRFDPEIECNLKKQATGSSQESRDLLLPPQLDCRVPDYLRNPFKYKQYTFDSANDLNDEEANKKAFMEVFNLVRHKRVDKSQTSADNAGKSPSTVVTFVPRKKPNDGSTEQGEASKRSAPKANIMGKGATPVPVIAAADEASAMEEDEEPETTNVCSNIPRKAQRQYRARTTLELLDE